MKQKMILSLLVLTLLLSGCATGQPDKVSYIGADSAKAIAVAAAGLPLEQVSFSGVDMSTRAGIDYYHVQFTSGGEAYEYHVDALTGSLIETESPSAGAPSAGADDTPSVSQAGNPTEGSLVTDASTGDSNLQQPPTASSQGEQNPAGGEKKVLSEDEMKAIALAHAGISADQAIFVKVGLDRDDGRETYDLEFYTKDHREFDYDIDPYTGKVLSYDHDAEYYVPPASGGNDDSGRLTAEEAKAIALAQVPGAKADNIREFEVDYDDGRLEYEGKIYYEHMEYEFEIDGYSGAIRNWDVESIYD